MLATFILFGKAYALLLYIKLKDNPITHVHDNS
jgi:hypothetical protein